MEAEDCVDTVSISTMEDGNSPKNELKRDHHCVDDGIEPCSPPTKKHVKEASNEELLSEVLNPTLSLKENGSTSLDITSQLGEATASVDGSRCSEDTSKLSGNLAMEEASSSDESSADDAESSGGDDSLPSFTKSCVLLEIPEHACTTGIRKIRISFSKRKECVEYEEDQETDQETEGSMTTGGICREPYANSYGKYPLMSESYLSGPNMELKMFKKVVPDAYPTNVKKLLSTGILNGARVTGPLME